MMPTIEFKFSLGQKVSTVVGDEGVIDMMGFSGYKNRYWILMKEGKGAWFDEDQLTVVE
jgi:hypothetical protein